MRHKPKQNMKSIFSVAVKDNGIVIRNKVTGGVSKVTLNADGVLVRDNSTLEGKDRQYANNIACFIEGNVNAPKLKKMSWPEYFKTLGSVLSEVADSNTFRALSNRARKTAVTAKLVPEQGNFYEVCR